MLSRGLSSDEVSAVYRRYGAVLERRCRVLLRDRTLAEDAMQELVMTLLRRGRAFRDANAPYRWLCRAADTTCLDVLRRARRIRSAQPLDALDDVGPAPGADVELRAAVLESLASLADDEQRLAIMLFVDGMSQGEAADELGVSRVTVNKRASELRERLRARHQSSPDLEPRP